MPPYPFEIQVKIVKAIAVVNNFIRRFGTNEGEQMFIDEYEAEVAVNTETSTPCTTRTGRDRQEAAEYRDNMARAMWDSYQGSLNNM